MSTTSTSHDDLQSATEKLDARLLGFACWMPIFTFLALFGFAAIAWIRQGHWPYYANPDPKELDLPFLHAAALLAYPITMVSVPACLLVVIVTWKSLRRLDVVVFALGTSLWAFMLPITGPLFGWLID